MPSSSYALIRQALLARKQVTAMYDGHPREMCPHILGWKKGEEHCLFFQFGGSSGSGLEPGGSWRCLRIAELSNISVRPGQWHSGAITTGRRSSCVDEIDVEVTL